MQWRCKQEIEDALWDAARSQLPAAALQRKRLLQAIGERTELYTTGRDALLSTAGMSMPASDLAARALFFTVADSAKISIPLSELDGRGYLPQKAVWRVLDLGAGAGAMGLGLLSYASEFFPGVSVEIDAADLDEDALDIYKRSLESVSRSGLDLGPLNIRCTQSSTSTFEIETGKYDFVVLGSVLNELRMDERAELASRAMSGVNEGGALIIIEPALRETSRSLHEVRDSLVESGTTIFAPCTRRAAPCPALEDPRDWCHEDRAVVLPSRARQMSQATGLRDGGLKFSYLVARHSSDSLVPVDSGAMALRVVGQPQRGKGQKECFVCCEAGRGRLRLLRRDRTSSNRIFDRAKRGDVLVTNSLKSPLQERTDIQKTQRIVRMQPAERDD